MNPCGRFCLRPIREDDLPKLFTFLQAFEYRCTALSSLFAQRTHPEEPCRFTLPVRNTCFVLEVFSYAQKLNTTEPHGSLIAGLLSYSSSGLLYHCLPFMEKDSKNGCFVNSGTDFYTKPISDQDKDDLHLLFTDFFTEHCAEPPLSSMMGGLQSGMFLEGCVPKKIREERDCKLMSLSTAPSSGDTRCGTATEILKKYTLHLCSLADSERLSDLMKAYYIEEVLPAGMIITDKDMSLFLKQRLKKQLVFAMENENGIFEAMAATTALGIQTARLGGIYTLPESRRKGLASALVNRLTAELLRLHYLPVLFVRTANPGAEKLYTNCGYSVCGGYRITYY